MTQEAIDHIQKFFWVEGSAAVELKPERIPGDYTLTFEKGNIKNFHEIVKQQFPNFAKAQDSESYKVRY